MSKEHARSSRTITTWLLVVCVVLLAVVFSTAPAYAEENAEEGTGAPALETAQESEPLAVSPDQAVNSSVAAESGSLS